MKESPISTSPVSTAGTQAAAISNFLVHLMAEYIGRGPTRARTYINDDLITVLLRDTLTKGDQTLVRGGESTIVLGTRRAYQETMRIELIAGIESITGRTVEAFLSANTVHPDVAVESFVLVPIGDAPGVDRVK